MRRILCCLAIILSATTTYTLEQEMAILRENIALEDTWDLHPMYPTQAAWKSNLQEEAKNDYKELLKEFESTPKLSIAKLRSLYDLVFSIERRLSKLYTYAHLVHDQQIDNEEARSAFQQASLLYHKFSESTSWIQPKILSHTAEELSSFCTAPELAPYSILLQRLLRMKEHTLTEEQENLLAMSSRAMEASQKAFSMLTDADFSFTDVEDSEKNRHPLTNGSYGVLLRSFDKTLRKNAFETMHKQYSTYQNTICELLHGVAEQHLFDARAHKFSSCLEAALHPFDISPQVYKNLIATVRAHVGTLHRYMRLKKQCLGVEKLYPWDLYVPLQEPNQDRKYSFDEAAALITKALSPLGETYVSRLSQGLLHSRWSTNMKIKGKGLEPIQAAAMIAPPTS
jgi:oligoendopeptidase F